MRTRLRTINPLWIIAGSICLLGSFNARAASLHVSAASATTNKVYDLTFTPPGGTSTPLGITPLPASPRSSLRSMVYLPNDGTGVLDLIAADGNGSRIVRYAGATGSAVNVWAAPAIGPKSPEGLSVDSSGNLFVVRGDLGHPELWVFRRDPTQPSGAFLAPVLVDKTSYGTGSLTRLLETVVVRNATAGGLTPDDVLVLVSDGRVMRYSASSMKTFVNNGLIITGPKPVPQTVVTARQSPLGQLPTGMAMWPADSSLSGFSDSSLLVATLGGSILRYQLTPTGSTLLPAFATGLGISLGKIKTFTRLQKDQNGRDIVVPYAVFDQPLRSKILEFGTPPAGGCPNLKAVCNNTLASITSVSNPVALATTDASVPSSACVTSDPNALGGCTLLGGGLQVSTTSGSAPNSGSSLLAESCIITDPRSNGLGHCDGRTLSVKDYCPNFPATVIPAHLCATGQADSQGHNTMAVMKVTEKNPLAVAPNDLVVNMDVIAEALLGGSLPPPPVITSGWAPLSSEVAASQLPHLPDWSLHPEMDQFVELASVYDAPASRSPGHSLVLAGVQIDPSHFPGEGTEAQQVSFADQKFASLLAIVNPLSTAPITSGAKTDITNCVSKAQGYLDDPHGNLAKSDRYACAARQLRTCESGLIPNAFGPNTNQLSAYSAVDGRLLNLFTHIYSRLGGNPPPASLPLPTPVPSGQCDDTTPNAPSGLSATNVTQTSLTLNWNPAAANGVALAGYYVLRNGTQVSAVGACTNCSFNDTGLTPGTTYHYSVESYDSWNPPGVSSPSATLDVSTVPNCDPSTPDALTAMYVSSNTGKDLMLHWSASTNSPPNASCVVGYRVYLGDVPVGTTSNTSFPITLNTNSSADTFQYQVTAYDQATQAHESEKSSAVSVSCYDPDRDSDPDSGEEPDCDAHP